MYNFVWHFQVLPNYFTHNILFKKKINKSKVLTQFFLNKSYFENFNEFKNDDFSKNGMILVSKVVEKIIVYLIMFS